MMTTSNAAVGEALRRLQYPLVVMLTCAGWYVAYPLGLCHAEQ
jgi:hypothetical protein